MAEGRYKKTSISKKIRSRSRDEERPTLAFKILSESKTKKLMEAEDVDELERLVAELLEITDIRLNLKSAVLLDYYVSALWWTKEQSFNADQTSAFFTIIETLLRNIEKQQMNLASNVQTLKKMMVGIGRADDPPPAQDEDTAGGLQTIFDVEQAKKVADYVHQGLFQHYKMYELLFSEGQTEHIVGIDLEVEMPKSADIPWPSPLCEAIPEKIHRQHFQKDEEAVPELQTAAETGQSLPDDDGKENEEDVEEGGERLTEEQESALLGKLSPEQILKVIDEVCTEMLSGLESEVSAKLRKKETEFVNRINHLAAASDEQS